MNVKFRGLSLGTSTSRPTPSHSRARPNIPGAYSRAEKRVALGLLSAVLVFFAVVSFLGDGAAHDNHDVNSPMNHNPHAISGSVHDLEKLLRALSMHENGQNPWVVVIAVNYAYRDFALNFICNLHRLDITNYLALAMDRAVFDHLSRHGAHVFFAGPAVRRRDDEDAAKSVVGTNDGGTYLAAGRPVVRFVKDGDDFGTNAFLETSRRKSLLVLKVLKLGFNVLFSDVDVVWVRNPFKSMSKYPADIVLQSDTRFDSQARPLNYNVNSGLYFARSNKRSIRAFGAIIKYSRAIRRSEQKAFNYVLCGAFKGDEGGPGMRVGHSNCEYRRAKTTVHVLPNDEFPNGSNDALWSTALQIGALPSVTQSHIIAVHANYVRGANAKKSRIQGIGFWKYDPLSRRNGGCMRDAG